MSEHLQTVIALVCFGTAASVLGGLAAILWRARGSQIRLVVGLIAALVLWYGTALAAGHATSLSFPEFLTFALIPISVGSALTFTPRMRTLLAGVPTHWLLFLQFYRVAGAVFLYAYYSGNDVLSRGFALNAGWGDVLTGVLAIPVGFLVMRRTRGHFVALVFWSVIGIGDLLLAPLSARLYGAGDLDTFPLNSIPLFLGPPLGILLHVVALRSWWLREEGRHRERETKGATRSAP